MSNTKRRDNKDRVLQMGENQLDDGRYAYRYTTPIWSEENGLQLEAYCFGPYTGRKA